MGLNLGVGLGPAFSRRQSLIRAGLVAYIKNVEGALIDTVGELINSYDDLTTDQQAFFFTDPTTLVTWTDYAAFWADVSVQSWFNLENVVGREDKGAAIYTEDTSRYILNKALRYFGQATVEPTIADRYLNTDHYTNMGHYV